MTLDATLHAGAGQADVTPDLGIQLAGDIGRPRPVEEIRNRIYVRALILESGGRRACVIAADVTTVIRKHAEELRRLIAEAVQTTPDAVIIHAGQSHSAPSVGNHMMSDDFPLVPADLPWLRGGDDRYIQPFGEGVMAAVREALASRRPATMRAARGMDGRVSFNRRFIMRDGTVKTHPPVCHGDILCAEGPADPEVGVVVFDDAATGKPMAALLHHTCHPVHGYPARYVCPDWPGLWAVEAGRLIGDGCIAMTLNGACGNIHHNQHLNPKYRKDLTGYVACLTETVQRLLPQLQPLAGAPLAWDTRTPRIPLRRLPAADVAAARKLVADHPEPMWNPARDNIHWDWVYALATLDLARRQEKQTWYDYEIQAVRVGDLALVAWPGEPFVEGQLELKKNSPARQTFVAHMSSDCTGYLPTREALQRGGYETRTANWSKLDPSALETVTAESKGMLASLFGAARA